jgi:hypothetical protein
LNADDILKIIEVIPEYIKYIYPGYLTIYIYFFLRGKTLRDNNYIFLKSVAISYIYLSMIECISSIKLFQTINNKLLIIPYSLKLNIALISIALLFSYFAYRIAMSSRIIKIFSLLNINTTFYDNEIEALSNYNEGAWICVYLKNDTVVYEGSVGMKELEEEKRKYICLNSYYKYLLNENGKPIEPYIEDHADNPNESVMIFYDDIKIIEKRDV